MPSQNKGPKNIIQGALPKNLKKLQNLTFLHITEFKTDDICSLEKLTGLQALVLSNTEISDLRGLEKLSRLHSLYLSGTQISDLNVLNDTGKTKTSECLL